MESREKIWKMNILQLTTNSMYLKWLYHVRTSQCLDGNLIERLNNALKILQELNTFRLIDIHIWMHLYERTYV